MGELQIQDVSEAVLASMTEEEFANWQRQQGMRFICHRGRYWEELRPGFYQPIHLLARLSAEQATRPAPLCWGFRSALCEDDVGAANGSIPIHLLSNFKGYDLQSLPSHRRNHVRKCRKRVKLVQLINSALLQEQGYEVVCSAIARTAHSTVPQPESYQASLVDYISPGHRLVLAGLIDCKLGGYITGYAVSGTAYIENVYIATEALPTSIGSGLIFEFMQACYRCGAIREVVYGQHSREDQSLCLFKEEMGFPVKLIPGKIRVNPIIAQYMRWRYPHKYYRLTGHN